MINLTHEVIDVPKTRFTEGVNQFGNASNAHTTSELIQVTPGATYSISRYFDKEVTLPNGYNFIEAFALQDANIYNINLPSSLVRIDEYRLSRNPFTEINIPSNITMVYEGVFWECKNLKRVKFPNTLHTIEKHAFSDCTSLENIFLPDSLTKIGNSAFMNCSIKKLIIPKNVSTLEPGAFKNNKGLRYVKIPNRLKSTFSGYLMSSWFTDEADTDTNITYEYY